VDFSFKIRPSGVEDTPFKKIQDLAGFFSCYGYECEEESVNN
jgi:hypothetical protein